MRLSSRKPENHHIEGGIHMKKCPHFPGILLARIRSAAHKRTADSIPTERIAERGQRL